MSVVRRSAQSEVYMYELVDGGGLFHCQICSLRAGGDAFMSNRLGAALHLVRHWIVGHKIPLVTALRAL